MRSHWRPVPGFEDVFLASPGGLVRSVRTGRLLRQRVHPNGYALISTRVGGRAGRAVCQRVHRLVAKAWVPGETVERRIVHHRNGDRLDNRACNLEWVTSSENSRYALASGAATRARGAASASAKLTEADVLTLRRLYRGKSLTGVRALAARYGVDHGTLYQAIRGRTWKHLPMEVE